MPNINEFKTEEAKHANPLARKEFNPASIDLDEVLEEIEKDPIQSPNGPDSCVKKEQIVDDKKDEIKPVVEGIEVQPQIQEEVKVEVTPVEAEKVETGENATTDDDEELRLDPDEEFKNLKNEIKNESLPFTPIDTSGINIGNPIAITNTIDPNDILQEGIWPLLSEGRVLRVKELRGALLNSVITVDDNKASYNDLMNKYGKIYKHVESAKEPTVKAWIDNIDYTSYDDLNFSIYIPSFKNANHMALECSHCGKNYLDKNIPMEKMYRCKDDAVKEKFESVMRSGNTSTEKPIKLKQISNEYFIGLKIPSIYRYFIEPKLLKPEFAAKWEELIAICSYIDSIQYIERDQQTGKVSLRPIQIKEDPDNPSKSLMDRLKKFIMIINKLTSDQYMYMISLINELDREHSDSGIEYLLPESTCPKCGKTTPAQRIFASQLLFTRHQLVTLANTER